MDILQAGTIAPLAALRPSTAAAAISPEMRQAGANTSQTGVAQKTRQTEATASPSATQEADKRRQQEKEAESLTDAANNELSSLTTALAFSVDRDVDRFVVKLVDVNSQEVLRQYPAEEMLEVYKALKKVTALIMPDATSGTGNPLSAGEGSSGILLSSKA